MEIAGLRIIASIFLGILMVIVTKLWDPIADCVGYPFHARRRVKNLLDEVERLRQIEGDLCLDPKPSSERYKGWVKSVQDVCLNANKIKIGHDGCGPLNYFNKCYFAKEADMELKKATDLVGTGEKLLEEAQAKPQAVRRVLPQQQHQQIQLWGMDSYKHKVRDFIQNNDNNSTHQSGLLGIWGMGGVGKTSLLEFVRDSPAVPALSFDHVLFVPVGTMQKAIAASLGLSLKPDDGASVRATIIYSHLQDKSFLLLIDDLWGNHDDLKHVGIPMPLGKVICTPHGGGLVEHQRKVVFTTRSYDVCGRMECANNAIRMECLSEDDAWNLFVDKVGKKIIDDNRKLQNLARKVVDECSGLPRALCILGQVMSAIIDPKEWESTLHLLEKSKFREMDDLFESLKLSYDDMENNFKDCFLVCALWPRDENIPKEKLVGWWTGLGFLDDGSNAIYRGYSIINALVRKSMLEEGDTSICSSEKSHVKMHEVTRKMALWVVNDHGDKEKCLPLLSSCTSALPEEKWSTVQKAWISVIDSSEWSSSVDCPELTMLVSRHAFSFEASLCFQNITFLDLEGTKMDMFPLVICQLKKLQYLNLSATTIAALPLELKGLSNLKYLYIRDNGALQAIPEELISQLAKLRVLDLFCSGTNSNKGQYFSSLIEGFPSKKIDLILGITVHTVQDIMKLTGPLRMVVHTQALCMHRFKAMADGHLELLCLMEKLRELTITNSPDIKTLVVQRQPRFTDGIFPNLEFLELSNLRELQNVTWKNACLTLRVITIYNCTKLRHVTWVQCLETLEELTIAYCPELEKVIGNAESSQDMAVANRDQVKSFGQLKKLYLEELPKLSIISEHSIPFEELSYVFVARCENLKIIRVGQRRKHKKIKIDCHEGWWTGLKNKLIMNLDFVPTFCLGRLEGSAVDRAVLSAGCAAANSIPIRQ